MSCIIGEIIFWAPNPGLYDVSQVDYFVTLALSLPPLLPLDVRIQMLSQETELANKTRRQTRSCPGTSVVEQESQVKSQYSSSWCGFQELPIPTSLPKQVQTRHQTAPQSLKISKDGDGKTSLGSSCLQSKPLLFQLTKLSLIHSPHASTSRKCC